MSKTKWYDSDNPSTVARGATWRVMVWVAAIVAFCLVIGAIVWGVRVLVAEPQGRGDAYRLQQSGTNRIAAQERFEDLYQEILSADRRLDALYQATKSDPKDNVAKTNYTGAVNYCIDVVADYNAEARKYTSAEFRAIDLPAQIDNLAAATDCQPTKN